MSQVFDRSTLSARVSAVTESSFAELALDVFRYQVAHNPVYRQFTELLGIAPEEVSRLDAIPCLPIGLFKQYVLQTGEWKPERIFTSSGTTGATTSRHALRDGDFYRRTARRGFAHFYGPVEDYTVLALLPSYLEREGSSLIYMAQDFIERSADARSGFFLHEVEALLRAMAEARAERRKVLLLGVSFALLDLAELQPADLGGVVVMETGGMKGRREEITREDLHARLRNAFGLAAIHSEYGMTELLSQAYSRGGGIFHPAPSMRVWARDITDPLSPARPGKTGALNLIDLANLDTVSFIATDDLGRIRPDGGFEVLGRLDAGDLRGCNLLLEEIGR